MAIHKIGGGGHIPQPPHDAGKANKSEQTSKGNETKATQQTTTKEPTAQQLAQSAAGHAASRTDRLKQRIKAAVKKLKKEGEIPENQETGVFVLSVLDQEWDGLPDRKKKQMQEEITEVLEESHLSGRMRKIVQEIEKEEESSEEY